MDHSFYIDRLVRLLRAFDVKVHLYAFDLPCAGMYRSETKEVFLNEPTALGGLLTLAHEAGHWLGYEGYGEKRHSYQRERQAFVYGWQVLELIEATNVVSRAEWINAERARRAAPDVDTSMVASREEDY
jgi:hypothetical protein